MGIATADRQEDPSVECLADLVAERSKARVWGRTIDGVASSNAAGGVKKVKPGQSRQRVMNKIYGVYKGVGIWHRNFNNNSNV